MRTKLGRKLIFSSFVLVAVFWGLGKAFDNGFIDDISAGILYDLLKIVIPLAGICVGIWIFRFLKKGGD